MPFKQVVSNWLRECFGHKDTRFLMEKELREASLDLLRSESAMEYSRCMVEYNSARVYRLKNRIEAHKGTQ
jgi:hypothetical protein